MAESSSYKEMAERWAEIVIERWIRKIQALNIGSTGELLKSLQESVNELTQRLQELRDNETLETIIEMLHGDPDEEG